MATGAGRVAAEAYVDWARPGWAEGTSLWEGLALHPCVCVCVFI